LIEDRYFIDSKTTKQKERKKERKKERRQKMQTSGGKKRKEKD
jgi:rRNA processing protein Gar1